MRAESYFAERKYEKRFGEPFLTERPTAIPLGYNSFFDVSFWGEKSREFAIK